MSKRKALTIVAALCFGAGIGISIGVASKNLILGIFVGLSLFCSFFVTMNAQKN